VVTKIPAPNKYLILEINFKIFYELRYENKFRLRRNSSRTGPRTGFFGGTSRNPGF